MFQKVKCAYLLKIELTRSILAPAIMIMITNYDNQITLMRTKMICNGHAAEQ